MRTLQILTAIGLIFFWIVFFTIGFANEDYPVCYETFEHCFPLPDGFIAAVLIAAWLNYPKNRTRYIRLTRVAGGAMIFLGLCDISFNTLNGMYSISPAELLMNGFINIWCIGLGSWQAFGKLNE